MSVQANKAFGALITRLINKESLTRQEAHEAFCTILNNQTTPMQQGAFLSALTAKGETAQEVAGAWEAIYVMDTAKVTINKKLNLLENSGTGMDTFKTFNISTAASIIAAAGGIPMARHGARAITSVCGTVDMAEALGVDVECHAELVAKSIETAGIGLFNGMSPHVHPKALGRILSQIHFGSTLNIAASLANPALPAIGVRGVYAKEMIRPVAKVMKSIGYQNAMVLYGSIRDSSKGMDEASVCGPTFCAKVTQEGEIDEFAIAPETLGMDTRDCKDLVPEGDIQKEAKRFASLMAGKDTSARKDAAILNAGLIFYVAGKASFIEDGIEQAARILEKGSAFETLEKWVLAQNTEPEKGLEVLHRLV